MGIHLPYRVTGMEKTCTFYRIWVQVMDKVKGMGTGWLRPYPYHPSLRTTYFDPVLARSSAWSDDSSVFVNLYRGDAPFNMIYVFANLRRYLGSTA
jgi:hypothetical protein